MKTIINLSSAVIALLVILSACNKAQENKQTAEIETQVQTDNANPDAVLSKTDSPDGAELFHSRCMVCHLDKRPTIEQRSKMLAPPIMGVMFHLKDTLRGTTEVATRKMIIDFIVDYAQNPAREKSYCMPAAINRFGVMPSISASTTAEEVEAIANYLYDNYPPTNFNHNQMDSTMQTAGSGRGKGKGINK